MWGYTARPALGRPRSRPALTAPARRALAGPTPPPGGRAPLGAGNRPGKAGAAAGRARASVLLSPVILQGVFSYNEIIHVETSAKVGWSAARVKARERGEEEIIR